MRTDRQTDRQTDRPTDRQTDRQTDIVTYRAAIPAKKNYVQVTPEIESQLQCLPVSFQLIDYVCKESSASTTLRVVTNSRLAVWVAASMKIHSKVQP